VKYTLFIDESGDFESNRGEWLISGALFEGALQEINQALNTQLKGLPSELNVRSIKDFHLTEFRRDFGHTLALKKAEIFLSKISKLNPGFKGLAVINFVKHSLSEREKTYRAMLSDMIALVDNTIPEDNQISHLDIVVATRTINGELQTTTDDLRKDVINNLPQALEYDLASLGITGLIGKNLKITQDYANNLWGLVCADFIANINYHRKQSNEKALLNRLAESDLFVAFEAFGNHHERRARIAERNHDYVLSLFRWILIREAEKTDRLVIDENLVRLFNKNFQNSGSSGAKINLEALIEKLWRYYTSKNQYDSCIEGLRSIEFSLVKSNFESYRFKLEHILFRVRNLVLLLMNHQGDTVQAKDIISVQQEQLNRLISSPENLSLVLDFNLIELEYYVNSLDLNEAKVKARNYLKLINNYQEVWQLFNEDYDSIGFYRSSFWIKSNMAALRIECINPSTIESQEEVESKFDMLRNYVSGSFDRSRLNNYYLLYLLKTNQNQKALNQISPIVQQISDSSVFDLFWIVNVINNSLLNGLDPGQNFDLVLMTRLDDQRLLVEGHPNDIVWREVALYFWLKGDKSKALKFIKRAQNLMSLKNSPIASLLRDMNNLYEGLFKDNPTTFTSNLVNVELENLENPINILEQVKKIRTISPY